MLSFQCDYAEGCHQEILDLMARTNREGIIGYGCDEYSARAKKKIAAACGYRDDESQPEIFFLVGGTQTNQVVISTMLDSYQGVIAADTGHIGVHEAGAIEYTGHKVLTIPHKNGKLDAADVKSLLKKFYGDGSYEHMVFPGMVYISHPSEYGTLYTLEELTALSEVCREYDIPLFLDGARLGYGLMAEGTDVTMADIARLTDVFYIGGTKLGALFGEAVVFAPGKAPKHFYTMTKQHGAMLAKGWLLGLQFDALFTDDLYMKAGRNAIEKAGRLRKLLAAKGYNFFMENPTNQIFVVVENGKLKELEKNVCVSFWEAVDDSHTVVRFATGWATTDKMLDELDTYL